MEKQCLFFARLAEKSVVELFCCRFADVASYCLNLACRGCLYSIVHTIHLSLGQRFNRDL